MREKESISDELYHKLGKFSDVKMYDSSGEETIETDKAVLYQFNYANNDVNPKIVTINIVNPEGMEIIISKDIIKDMDSQEKNQWYSFIDNLRDFALTRFMGWKVHDITKQRFDKNDFNFLLKNSNYTEKDNVTLENKMYGSRLSSYHEGANKTRLIVRHNKPVHEEVHGARSRNIKAIYVENSNGERFLVPRNHLPTARALARHVANEGLITDSFGKHIVEMHDEMSKLRSFVRKCRTTENMMEGSENILEAARTYYNTVKETLESLQKQSGYAQYKETYKESINEDTVEEDDYSDLKERLTRHVYNEEFNDVLPLLRKVVSLQEKKDDGSERDKVSPVKEWLSSNQPLKLFRHPEEQDMVLHKLTDMKTKFANILSNIATNAGSFLPDEVVLLSSEVSDILTGVERFYGTPEEKSKSNEDFKIKQTVALELAKRYLDDIKKMEQNPKYERTVRADKLEKKKEIKKDKKVKEVQEFESWANEVTEDEYTGVDMNSVDMKSAIQELSEYAYEIGNAHTDYQNVIDVIETLKNSNIADLKDVLLDTSDDARKIIVDIITNAGSGSLSELVLDLPEENEEEFANGEMDTDDLGDSGAGDSNDVIDDIDDMYTVNDDGDIEESSEPEYRSRTDRYESNKFKSRREALKVDTDADDMQEIDRLMELSGVTEGKQRRGSSMPVYRVTSAKGKWLGDIAAHSEEDVKFTLSPDLTQEELAGVMIKRIEPKISENLEDTANKYLEEFLKIFKKTESIDDYKKLAGISSDEEIEQDEEPLTERP